jgi:Phage minor capsid protein 2
MPQYLDIEGRSVPQPQYKHDTDVLVEQYKRAMLDIKRELERLDVTSFSRAQSQAMLKQVEKALKELDLFAAEWVAANIPQAATDGTAATLVNLGLAATIEEAREVVKFNKLNKAMIELYVADTQKDLLEITSNVSKRVRNAVREVTGEVMRAQMAKGVNGIETQNRLIVQQLREKLGKSIETGIVDAARNRWNPIDYVDMTTRTKMLETYRQAQTNEAVTRGAVYGIITFAGAKDACRFHEGRIIKLVPTAEGNYPTYDELKASNQIFHPRCRHHFTVFRNADRLPEEVRETAAKQHERGNAALATGKRNPKM